MKPNSFLIKVGGQRNKSDNAVFQDNKVLLLLKDINPDYIKYSLSSDEFSIFFGEKKKNSEEVNYKNPINGSSVVYSAGIKEIKVTSDLTGLEVLYYRTTSDFLYISNRIENLITDEDVADWHGIYSYLAFGYTIGADTLISDVKQLKSNCILTIDIEEFSFKESKLIAINHVGSLRKQDCHKALSKIKKVYSEIERKSPEMALMASAGWDSRTLLALGPSKIKLAYSHGDLSSREIRLAKELSGKVRIDHHFYDIRNMDFSLELLDEMLVKQGHCLWPIWAIAAKHIQVNSGLPLISGALGARLGGHCGFSSFGGRLKRIWLSLNFVSKKLVSDDEVVSHVLNHMKLPEEFWFTSKEFNELLEEQKVSLERKIESCIKSYLLEEDDVHFAIERFNYDHRDRQYIAKQPTTAKMYCGYRSPLSDPELLAEVYKLPLKFRFHNSINRLLVKSLDKTLLEYPMAATLAKAKRPILVQEGSRILRILSEKFYYLLNKEKPNLGWFNYENIYELSLFQDIIESLQSNLWDVDKMKKTIATNQANGIDAGSTLDMLCKIKTVDYYLCLLKK